MMAKDIAKKPLENFFNLPVDQQEEEPKALDVTEHAPSNEYDDKDKEVEELYSDIQERALIAHEKMLDDAEDIDTKYMARHYEVASTYLNIALHAAEKRGKLKEHKDKLNVKTKGATKNTTNNTLVINTTDLIKQLSSGDVIEAEVISEVNQEK